MWSNVKTLILYAPAKLKITMSSSTPRDDGKKGGLVKSTISGIQSLYHKRRIMFHHGNIVTGNAAFF
jgi:hypothetical protein